MCNQQPSCSDNCRCRAQLLPAAAGPHLLLYVWWMGSVQRGANTASLNFSMSFLAINSKWPTNKVLGWKRRCQCSSPDLWSLWTPMRLSSGEQTSFRDAALYVANQAGVMMSSQCVDREVRSCWLGEIVLNELGLLSSVRKTSDSFKEWSQKMRVFCVTTSKTAGSNIKKAMSPLPT